MNVHRTVSTRQGKVCAYTENKSMYIFTRHGIIKKKKGKEKEHKLIKQDENGKRGETSMIG